MGKGGGEVEGAEVVEGVAVEGVMEMVEAVVAGDEAVVVVKAALTPPPICCKRTVGNNVMSLNMTQTRLD